MPQELIGLDGLGYRVSGLAETNVPEIIYQNALTVVKGLPNGDAIRLIKQMPEEVLADVCKSGVTDNILSYLPMALSGLGVGMVVGYSSRSIVYGTVAALAVAGIVYMIRKPDATA